MIRRAGVLAVSLAMLWAGSAWAQTKAACTEGRVSTPQKVEGQVVKVDSAQKKVTVRDASGVMHEFQASPETLKDLKAGDRIEANLREAPKCP